jgi:hypothetical protein
VVSALDVNELLDQVDLNAALDQLDTTGCWTGSTSTAGMALFGVRVV